MDDFTVLTKHLCMFFQILIRATFLQDENLKAQMQNFLLSTQSQQEITGLDGKVGLWEQKYWISHIYYFKDIQANFAQLKSHLLNVRKLLISIPWV